LGDSSFPEKKQMRWYVSQESRIFGGVKKFGTCSQENHLPGLSLAIELKMNRTVLSRGQFIKSFIWSQFVDTAYLTLSHPYVVGGVLSVIYFASQTSLTHNRRSRPRGFGGFAPKKPVQDEKDVQEGWGNARK
jgi:hypothetical protein